MARQPKSSRTWSLRVRTTFLLILFAVSGILVACDAGSATPTVHMGTPVPTRVMAPGELTFTQYCNVCHPGGGRGAGPSLRMSTLSSAEVKEYVRHGKNRMPGFGPSSISDQELEDLVQYVISLRR